MLQKVEWVEWLLNFMIIPWSKAVGGVFGGVEQILNLNIWMDKTKTMNALGI
jgi:hypothetical protein